MIIILINIFVIMLPTCFLMYYSTNLLSKNDNNTILLTKILPSKINEPEILDIVKRFKKDNLKMTILFAIMIRISLNFLKVRSEAFFTEIVTVLLKRSVNNSD